ncbi:MAG TPA: hypothetical protein VFJ29_06270, partial [Candidatus Kapabacteria bacterium]|nr:hypothetical protein [Candidatus Kapabacteria bacterium]
NEQKIFTYKLDFYYQAMAIYAVTLAAYAVVVSFTKGSMDFVMKDQVVYLLAFCTLASAVGLLINVISGRTIIVEIDKIVFASRFHRREIKASDILWIHIGREKRMKVRGSYRVAKIKLRERRRLLRLRPSLFRPEDALIDALQKMNVTVHKAVSRNTSV